MAQSSFVGFTTPKKVENKKRKLKQKLSYYGNAPDLTTSSYVGKMAGNLNGYAVIAGGQYDRNTVDLYDADLVKSSAPNLLIGKSSGATANVGGCILFAGGYNSPASWYGRIPYVDGYSSSFTRVYPLDLISRRMNLKGTTVGNYALFAGGEYYNGTNNVAVGYVDAYDASLVRSNPSGLVDSKTNLAATTVGNYALFAGGSSGDTSVYYTSVDAYDTSLVRSTPTSLTPPYAGGGRYLLAATTVGNYALFAGGNYSSLVDAYDKSLVRLSPVVGLSTLPAEFAATTVGDFALFAGGYDTLIGNNTNAVVAYDKSLVRSLPTPMSVTMGSPVGTNVGRYALFCGSGITKVEVYQYKWSVI